MIEWSPWSREKHEEGEPIADEGEERNEGNNGENRRWEWEADGNHDAVSSEAGQSYQGISSDTKECKRRK